LVKSKSKLDVIKIIKDTGWEPQISFSKGISEVGNIIKKTKIVPDVINIGGGFPSIYPDLRPEPLDNYLDEIKKGLRNLKLEKMPEIFCEPGRAIVAEAGSTIVKVVLKKKQKLYMFVILQGLYLQGLVNLIKV